MQGVCGELERCRTPDDQELVEGLIAKVFAKLPDNFIETLHEKRFVRTVCAGYTASKG